MRFVLSLILLAFCSKAYLQSTVFEFSAPGMEKLKNIRDVAILPNGNELYFTHQDPDFTYSTIYRVELKDGKWQNLQKASFCDNYRYLEPAFSPDGLRLYYVTDRPYSTAEKKDFDIWYIERKTANDAWSAPIHPDAAFNSTSNEFYPSVCFNGDIYFTSDREGTKGQDDIFYAPFKNGKYTEVISLSDSINSAGMEYNAWIAPDGSFLVFGAYKRTDGFGSGDLYISFSQGNGTWSKALNIGPSVNTERMDYCPTISIPNKQFYFTSRRQAESVSDKKYAKELEEFPGGRSRLFFLFFNDIPLLKGIR